MRIAVATILAAFSVAAVLANVPDDEYGYAFRFFEERFQKSYAAEQERESRFNKFKANYMYIARENAKGTNLYELGVNEFADLSPEEFGQTHFGFIKPTNVWGGLPNLGTHEYSGAPLTDSVDWVKQGAVTPVKNQGQCGSCWSFSTTGSLEGAWKIAGNPLVALSEEQLVECSTQNHGCQGGSMDLAFQFEEGVNVCTEASYPYTAGGGQAGSCKASSCQTGIPKGGVTGFKDVAHTEQALMEAVSQQPVSIAVEADKAVFQSYKSGVMTGLCGTSLDHGILVVGYGTENGQDYWLVKNSWGAVWGLQGYGKLERGKGDSGECGILAMASYPVASGKPGPSPTPGPTPPPTPPQCCISCTSPQVKYYSVDTKHGHCGEACMRPEHYAGFKIFERNLTLANGERCSDLGYPKYDSTVTHGFGPVSMTLDLYDASASQVLV